MIEIIAAQIVPALLGVLVAQRAPDHIIPVVKEPSTAGQSMTVISAIVAILLAVEAVQQHRLQDVNPEHLAAAAAVVWGLLPRGHQIIDAVGALWSRR
jgi:hypothetical protein